MDASTGPHVTLLGASSIEQFLLPDQALTIGSAHGNRLRLAHDEVAEVQCDLLWTDSSITIHDIVGTTRVNGQTFSGALALVHGDIINVGPYTLEFSWPDQPAQVFEAPTTLHGQRHDTQTDYTEYSTTLMEPMQAPLYQVLLRGEEVDRIPLINGLQIGSSPECDVFLTELGDTLYQHNALLVQIEKTFTGFLVRDLGTQEGALVNSRFFKTHELVIGDYLQVGSYHFRFDGLALVTVASSLGGAIQGIELHLRIGKNVILRGANFSAQPGQFIGILGPSGAGKTTLLNALSGLTRLTRGVVLLNGSNTAANPEINRSLMGYVPQDDIVHRELTVRQALKYSACLRLPDQTPRHEIDKLVTQSTAQLGLESFLDRTVSELSGGQRKRVSVGVELLNRPQILFLDEPTSGLDPGTEFQLMKILRSLTSTGCTVICTTHLMENVYLMDRITVVQDGLTVFHGDSMQTRQHFGVEKLTSLYDRLESRTADEWAADMPLIDTASALSVPPASTLPRERPRHSLIRATKTLLQRQCSILSADPKNFALLLGQPVLIGLLIAFAAVVASSIGTKLFLAYIATLWFGCSNSAQEIVKEKAIFRREKFVGLSTQAYLMSKFVCMSFITCVQAMILLGILCIPFYGHGLAGSLPWQAASLFFTSIAGTGIGLAISAWAKKPTQAIMTVPLLIIPQILFSGFVFELEEWNEAPYTQLIGRMVPSFASQRIMDTSLMWEREIPHFYDLEEKYLYRSENNLETSLHPIRRHLTKEPFEFTVDERLIYKLPEGSQDTLELQSFTWNSDEPPEYRAGLIFYDRRPALWAFAFLSFWTLGTYLLAWLFLRRV